jgi:hypothetical protein
LAGQQGGVARVAHEISTAAWFGGSLLLMALNRVEELRG